MDSYRGKTAIITGGASGIGRAIAEQVAMRGGTVILADLNADLAEETAAAIRAGGGDARAARLDVRDLEAVSRLVRDTAEERGRLDFVFNNAGVAIGSEAHEHTPDAWHKVIDTNLYGVINGVAAAYPLMVEQGFGHIVNTASTAGLIPVPGEISYVTSKHGVVGLSLALRMEGALHGVKVSVVCPGFIRTPIYDNAELIKLDREVLLSMLPRGTSPQKAAQVILEDVERNRAVIIPPRPARVLWWLNRLFPWLTFWIFKGFARSALRKARTGH